MRRAKKVLSGAALQTPASSVLLHVDHSARSISVGCRANDPGCVRGYIGRVAEQSSGNSLLDYSVWCDLTFPHVIGIFGTRGTGKSFDLGVFVECISGIPELIDGNLPETTVIVFDVQNQFWTLALSPDPELTEDARQLASLREWGLSAIGLKSVVGWVPPGQVSALPNVRTLRIAPPQLEQEDWLSVLDLERYSAMGQALIYALDNFGSLRPIELVEQIAAPGALASFAQQTVEGLLWRLRALAASDLLGVPGISIDELLMPGAINVMLLRDLPDSLRGLAVGVLTRLMASRMSTHHQKARIARRHKTSTPVRSLPERLWVVLDEAHVIVPSDERTAATGPVVDYVKRGRDAGLSMIFATQQPSAIDNRLMSQVDLTLTHSLAFDNDVVAAIGRMPTQSAVTYERAGLKLGSTAEAIRALQPGEALLADSLSARVFLTRIRPRVSAHGGNTPPLVIDT